MIDYMEPGTTGSSQPDKGLLIVFEGGDGTGKGEMMSRTMNYLANPEYPTATSTKDPGGTHLGQVIRQLLFVEPSTKKMAPGVCDLLFLASHLQNYLEVVGPPLDNGEIVVTDRWWYSQFVYGSHRWCMPEVIEAYRKYHGPRANLLIFLHGNAEECLRRANNRTELHQSGKTWNNIRDFNRVQQTYFDMFLGLPEFCPISANLPMDQVWSHVKTAINELLVYKGLMNA